MAEDLDVNTDVLLGIASRFDDTSREIDELRLPNAVDGGIASGDIHVLLAELSLDLAEIASGMDAMSRQLVATRQLYVDRDERAAEAIILSGDAG